jgi:hypothetical protein
MTLQQIPVNTQIRTRRCQEGYPNSDLPPQKTPEAKATKNRTQLFLKQFSQDELRPTRRTKLTHWLGRDGRPLCQETTLLIILSPLDFIKIKPLPMPLIKIIPFKQHLLILFLRFFADLGFISPRTRGMACRIKLFSGFWAKIGRKQKLNGHFPC